MKFGFIGCGHMGSTLVRKVCEIEKDVAICDINAAAVESLSKECGCFVANAKAICGAAKFVVLGVKPQSLADTIASIKSELDGNAQAVVISMAAGVPISTIVEKTGKDKVIRIMPNTPVLLGKGVISYATTDSVAEDEEKAFLTAFSSCGTLKKVAEEDIDACSVVASCAPAYVYEFIGALTKAGVGFGLDEKTALSLVCATVEGAAEMAKTFGDTDALTDGVCSKGGTTIEGVKVLRDNGFADTVKAAAKASYDRTLELKK
jgi:pyrroline-5-carboxylate reductase